MPSLVVKIGSSSATRSTGPDPVLLTSALDGALDAASMGWNVVLVSSGAVSSGTAYLCRMGQDRPSKRLAAAVGQPFLMDIYRSVSEISGSQVCQILISEGDLRSPFQMSTIASVLAECFEREIVPIVNGNDVTDPLGSDNDAVAVGIAVASGADKLLLLTDVPGVFAGHPDESNFVSELKVTDLRGIRVAARGTGRGGMRSKLRAAELAAYNGIETYIASARTPSVISKCISGDIVGTRVRPASEHFPQEHRWIAGIAASHGALTVNREAERSVRAGTSLFASGIKKVRGHFVAGSIVDIVTPSGNLVARGVSRVSALLLTLLRAMRSDEVALILTAVLYHFYSATFSTAGALLEPEIPRFADNETFRPEILNALSIIRSHAFENKRRLALEIICLFPTVTAEAMIGQSHDGWSRHLRRRYSELSSDLSLVDRGHLVVFGRDSE